MVTMKIIRSYGPTRTKKTQAIALIVAGLITIMLVAQLFSYEDFAVTLSALMPYSNNSLLTITAAAIVIAELMALPYLLGMYISTLMRIVSASLAVAVSAFWLFTSLTNAHASNSGFFSTTLEIPGGILPVALSLVLVVGAVLVIKADTKLLTTPLEKKH